MQKETRKRFKYFRHTGIFLISILLAGNSMAQDIHFSMYNSCPMILNPASTGNFTGDWRLALNIRNQWSTIEPFNTEALSFDRKIYIRNQNFGVGLFFIGDQAGSNSLNTTNLFGSLSYGRELNKNSIKIGLQLGYVHQGLGGSQTYPDQYDRETGNFDPNMPSNIENAGEKHSYLDVNLGLFWKKSIRIFEPEAGLSVFHLNSPNQSFFGGTDRLPMRFSIHSNVKTNISDEFYIMPSILYSRQDAATETMAGTNVGMNLLGNHSSVKEIFAGLYLRNGIFNEADALSVFAGTRVGRIEFALNYDLTVSNLSTATKNQSAFEISIIYKSISTVLNTYSIPCERY
jgi:type IX secretion system PorP/SprF family membrane protein